VACSSIAGGNDSCANMLTQAHGNLVRSRTNYSLAFNGRSKLHDR
jgi:hypothetical protein